MPEIVTRSVDEAARALLVAAGCDKRLAPLFAARGVREYAELASTFDALTPPDRLAHIDEAATLLADGIAKGEKLLVVADYDADGATACAVAVRALRALGAKVDYIVPHRFRHGYGLTPEVVREAAERKPDLIITVDNGIAAVAGVEEATKLGIRVLVTDHHLPGDQRPAATCIVNPNQAGCGFPSKNLAGVGVIFYVMLALRAELRRRGAFAGTPPPNLANLLDIVALGTVADVVKLDANNRILVSQGLARIRAGKACPGIRALFEVAGRPTWRAATYDLGFVAGPRLNAAGRMDDMSVGIECLITDDPVRARQLATELDRLNRERRVVEGDMQESALAMLADIPETDGFTLSIHHPDWHAGVVGILASRIKDRFHRPVFAFAADGEGTLRGSGRSIAGFHLRDALDLVDKRNAGLLERFGGHAAAAGVTLAAGSLERFRTAFESVARELLSVSDLERRIETDGELAADENTLELAKLLREVPWGQGFPDPRFVGRFEVAAQRVVAEKHAKLTLVQGKHRFSAMRFGSADPLPAAITAVYRLDVNEYQGAETLQLTLEHCEDARAGDG
ncbi:single-stranded-DNA-specific exonuclease RecJ [Usitatibacter palustris]|uniref:Single-stranded-DNA-specific exonuclease RecJ n=1 Tax=Usitatibacter palustris TaxID=2732487 RepID=A0A6M4H757_9PROT|nr:single-stranded-DNA-specific exonuclease RecJ [Usitatibacter palustris]QJR15469.1 Single-stranded-DNA-specific exonuclease RecJ [Usitatibacter palustris]